MNDQEKRDSGYIAAIYAELDKTDNDDRDVDSILTNVGLLTKSTKLNHEILSSLSIQGDIESFKKCANKLGIPPEWSQTYFRYFINSGNNSAVELYIRLWPDIDYNVPSYRTYLCKTGSFNRYKRLMADYKPIHQSDLMELESNLNTSCLSGYWNICQWILTVFSEHINIYYWSGDFFKQACATAPMDFIEWFISTYPDYDVAIGSAYPMAYDCLISCIKHDRFMVFDKIVQHYNIDVATLDINCLLCYAAKWGNIKFAEYLISVGADIHINNGEPLRTAETERRDDFIQHFKL